MIGMLLSMHRVSAVLSMTVRPLVRTSRYEKMGESGRSGVPDRVGGVDAVDLVALSSTSAPISAARSAAVVSVVKNGLPCPPARITTRPFSRWRMVRSG